MLVDALHHHTARRPDPRIRDPRQRIREHLRLLWADLESDLGPVLMTLVTQALWDEEVAAARDRLAAQTLAGLLADIRELLGPQTDTELVAARLVGPLIVCRFVNPRPLAGADLDAIVDGALGSPGPTDL